MSPPNVHVAIDGLGAKHSGGAMVLLDLLNALLAHPQVNRVTLFSPPRAERLFALPSSHKLIDAERPAYEHSHALRFLWNERMLGTHAVREGANVVVSMAATMQRHPRVPHVAFIQQSIPFSPEAMNRMGPKARSKLRVIRAQTRRSCRGARLVVVQTETMRRWVSTAFDLDPGRFEVVLPVPRALSIPASPAPRVAALMRSAPPDRSILYVGNGEPYKNIGVVADALPRLRAVLPGCALFVTLPASHPLCAREGVVPLGYLLGDELGTAFTLARALVQPSLVESGPLTMTEAMSVGTPVLVADRPYARDLCETAAAFFDPLDPAACASQLERLLTDEPWRETLRARGTALVNQRQSARHYERMADAIVRSAAPDVGEP